jgi:hypothetical protein
MKCYVYEPVSGYGITLDLCLFKNEASKVEFCGLELGLLLNKRK